MTHQSQVIHFSKPLHHALTASIQRWGFTPNTASNLLSYYIMKLVLPRANTGKPTDGLGTSYQVEDYVTEHFTVHGANTLKLSQDSIKPYVVYFGGNDQDSLEKSFVETLAKRHSSTNYIFQNYPGVGNRYVITHFHAAHMAGYETVKSLIDQGVPADQITLYGYSMGGGIASQVACQLHQAGYSVHLTVDRSFANLRSVAPNLINKLNEIAASGIPPSLHTYLNFVRQHPLAVTQFVSAPVLGLTLALLVGELVTFIGLTIATRVAGLGYGLSLILSYIPLFNRLAVPLNDTFNTLGYFIHQCFDALGSIAALVLVIPNLLIGLVIGSLLAFACEWTQKPLGFSLDFTIRALLNATVGELDNVRAIKSILKCENHGLVTVKNAMEDTIIVPDASLNSGLGLPPTVGRPIPNLGRNMVSFWYEKTDHAGPLNDTQRNHALSYFS